MKTIGIITSWLIGIMIACYAISGALLSDDILVKTETANVHQQAEFAAQGIDTIIVETISADIHLKPTDEAVIDATFKGTTSQPEEFRPTMRTEQAGSTLHIWIERPRTWVIGSENLDLDVTLPTILTTSVKSTSGDIDVGQELIDCEVSTVSGNIALATSSGSCTLASTSGDIDAAQLREATVKTISGNIDVVEASGTVKLDSTSGDVHITKARAGATIKTSSGNIDLFGASGQSRLESTSGDITAGYDAVNGDHYLESVSGNIDIRTVPQASFAVDARSISGDIRTSKALVVSVDEEHSLQGYVGNRGYTFTLKTTSGGIDIG